MFGKATAAASAIVLITGTTFSEPGSKGSTKATLEKIAPTLALISEAPTATPQKSAAAAKSYTGVVINPNGTVLAPWNCVRQLENIQVSFSDGQKLAAIRIIATPAADTALIVVRPSKPVLAAKFADSDKLELGDNALAVDSPTWHGQQSVTRGIVSRARPFKHEPSGEALLSIDTPRNPGSPEGLLFAEDGKIVGLTSKRFGSGAAVAIPSSRLKQIVAEMQAAKSN
jgi:serine protease Do